MKLKCNNCKEIHYTDEANDGRFELFGLKNYDCYLCGSTGTCKEIKIRGKNV